MYHITASEIRPVETEKMAEEDQPFKAEYAKSGRAGCKLCKGSISKDSLRLAKMVQVKLKNGVALGHVLDCAHVVWC